MRREAPDSSSNSVDLTRLPGEGAPPSSQESLQPRLRRMTEMMRSSAWRSRAERVLIVLLLVVGLLIVLTRVRSDLYGLTGDAEWMWISGDVQVPEPTSCLFVRRIFLHHRPAEAIAKVCGDRQYVLWVNGHPAVAGTNRPEFKLAAVTVTDLLVEGENTITIEAHSDTSVGAVLFALDLFPTSVGRHAGDPAGRNSVVSNRSWRVLEHWNLEPDDAVLASAREPWIWGQPPVHPWLYPEPLACVRPIVQAVHTAPVDIAEGRTQTADGQQRRLFPGAIIGGRAVAIGEEPPSAMEFVGVESLRDSR